MELRFAYDCVSCRPGEMLEELQYIIDHAREITLGTILKYVDRDDWNMLTRELGYGSAFNIKDDWHVTYWKSKTPAGQIVYYMCHSCIEYIFK